MGFPVGYTELLLPKIFLHLLSLLTLIRKLSYTIFQLIGLPDFLEPDSISSQSWPEPITTATNHSENSIFHQTTAKLAEEILPVVRYSDLDESLTGIRTGTGSGCDCCAVCLHEFEKEDEIRRLRNCRHIYHRRCVDRWMMGYNQMTCPLCRTPFIISHDLQLAFNQRLSSEANGILLY